MQIGFESFYGRVMKIFTGFKWLPGYGGGKDSGHRYLFKQGLSLLANEIGIEIRVAH